MWRGYIISSRTLFGIYTYNVGIALFRSPTRVFSGPQKADEQKVDTHVFYCVVKPCKILKPELGGHRVGKTMERININCKITCIIVVFIGLVIGTYCFFFHGMPISKNTSDWGSFGAYIGGMLTFLSVIFLYNTLTEQRKENHRNWFNAGFERRYKALKAYLERNQNYLQKLSKMVLEACKHSPFDDECEQKDAIIKINNLYIENQEGGERIIADGLFSKFKSTFEYINSDSFLDKKLKENYLTELEQSLPNEAIAIIICVMCEEDDIGTIKLLSSYLAFRNFQSGNPGFDNLKDALYQYNTKQE